MNLCFLASPAAPVPLTGSVAYGNTFWDTPGGDNPLQLDLPPPAGLLRSSLLAQQQFQQHRYQGISSLASTLAAAAAGPGPGAASSTLGGATSLGGSQALASVSDLLPIDAAHSFERTFRAPLSAGRLRASTQQQQQQQQGAGGSSSRARTPLDQSMAADSFLIYPAGRGVPRDTSRRGLGATLEVDEAPGAGQGDSSPAGQPSAAAGSGRGTLGTPLQLEDLYSRNEAKLRMLGALQGGPDDKEALEQFLARFVDGRMTPAAAKRPGLPDVGIQQQAYSSMLHTAQPGPLEMLGAVPALQPLMPLQQLVPMTPLLAAQGGFPGMMPAGLDFPLSPGGAGGLGGYGGDGFGGGYGGTGAGMGVGTSLEAPGRDSLALLLESLQPSGWEGATVVRVDGPSKPQAGPPGGYRPISASSRLQDSEPPGLAAAAAAGAGRGYSSRPVSGRLGGGRPASGAAGPVAGRRTRSATTRLAPGAGILDSLSRSSSHPVPAAAPEDASLMALGSRQRGGSSAGGTPVPGSRTGSARRRSLLVTGGADGAAGGRVDMQQQGYGMGMSGGAGGGSRPGSGAGMDGEGGLGMGQVQGGSRQRQRWSGTGGRDGSQVLQVRDEAGGDASE
jgi:hypothetical protein